VRAATVDEREQLLAQVVVRFHLVLVLLGSSARGSTPRCS
jgi:hypothetical protein